MSIEKIGSIIVSEIVEAVLFVIILIAISSFPEFPGKASIIAGAISFWLLAGIGTPFIIWFELWDMIPKGGLKY